MKDTMDILYCTGIYVAAQNGHKDIVKYLSDMDYTPSEDVLYKFTAFYLAAQNGLLDVIKDFMNKNFMSSDNMHIDSKEVDIKNADENHKSNNIFIKIADNLVNIENDDKDGNTWLHYAAIGGDTIFFNHLLEQGANPRALNNYHEKPIHFAASNGHNHIVQILVAQEVGVNVSNKNKDTPLHYAVKNKHINVVKELLKNKAKNLRNIYGYLPIHYSSSVEIDILLRESADNDYKDESDNTLLHIAALNGHCDIMKKIINLSVNIDNKNKDGNTALHLAAKHGQEAAVKMLIENHASTICLNLRNHTPCHTAIMNKNDDIALLILEVACDTLCKPNTFIHCVAYNGNKKLVPVLIKKGFYTINEINYRTPLMHAAENGHDEVCEILLDKDADRIDSTNKYKKTALHYAASKNKVKVVKMLLKYEAKLLEDEDNNTPLNIAISNGYKMIEKILTQYQNTTK